MVQESVVEMAAPVIPKRGISNIPKTIVGISPMVEAIVAIWKFPFEAKYWVNVVVAFSKSTPKKSNCMICLT